MGKWNYRRRWTPKNYYRDQRLPSPPTYYDTEFKLRGAWKNVDLPWEERFCISVGIPWEKVVTTKKYMYANDNVVKWNDSASEVTFRDAKQRFWAKINGIPSDLPEPDPDMYIDEIDWNPKIDPDLVKDLDQAYFNPDEIDKVDNFDDTRKKSDNLVPGCILGLENKNISDPWERGNSQNDRQVKDVTWGGAARDSGHNEISWGGGANNSWHRKYYPVQREDNIYKNTSFGREQWHGRHDARNNSWESNASCRKRQGSHQYTSSYKSARVQYEDDRWGRQRTQNRVSFARQ